MGAEVTCFAILAVGYLLVGAALTHIVLAEFPKPTSFQRAFIVTIFLLLWVVVVVLDALIRVRERLWR